MLKKTIKRIIYSNPIKKKILNFLYILEKDNSKEQQTQLIKRFRTFGYLSSIDKNIQVIWPKGIIIGNNVHIEENSYLDGRGGIIIGDNTCIGANCTLSTAKPFFEGNTLPYDQKIKAKEVVIEKNVWIDRNVCINPGIHIGEGSIIMAGSVINSDVKPGEIIGEINTVIDKRDWKKYKLIDKQQHYCNVKGYQLKEEELNNFLISPLQSADVVFVLSTGRSGSNSFTKLFDKNQSISAFHETFYTFLERLAINYLTGTITREKAEKKLVRYFSVSSILKNETIYIESDQKLVPFIDILKDIFNNPKFIWLIRHPKSFMHSAVSRGWFDKDEPLFFDNEVLMDFNYFSHATRITGYLTNEFTLVEWNQLDPRAKALWYWKYWNNLIDKKLTNIPRDQKLFLHLESLAEQKETIFDFLKLKEKINFSVTKSNQVKKKHLKGYIESQNKNYLYFEKSGFRLVKKEMKKYGYSE